MERGFWHRGRKGARGRLVSGMVVILEVRLMWSIWVGLMAELLVGVGWSGAGGGVMGRGRTAVTQGLPGEK
jgi:hypothetical protein